MKRFILPVLALCFAATPAWADTWYRADTHHFVIYSDGSERNLTQFAEKAEKFDALLRTLFNRQPEQVPNRLTIYLMDNSAKVDRLMGPKRSYVAGFYRPEAEGSMAVASREKAGEWGLDGQTVLFHEYAHHFMFRNMPIPTPAWFTEGFAEFMSTAEFERDGSWTYGGIAKHRAYSLLRGPRVPIRTLLSERAAGGIEDVSAFYGWSWALTHMLYRSDDRGASISAYLNALKDGAEPLAAAEASFGDLDELEKRLQKYIKGDMTYSRSEEPLDYVSDIKVAELSDYRSDLVELSLQRSMGYKVDRTRGKLIELAMSEEGDAEAWYQLARLEHIAAHSDDAPIKYDFTAAQNALDRALAMKPDHLMAKVLQGDLLLEAFDHGLPESPDMWMEARRAYGAANQIDPDNPLPLFRFGTSFLKEGGKHEQTGFALQQAFLGAPEAREIRFALAQYHAGEGDLDKAIGLLKVIAGNPHDGDSARTLIAALEQTRTSGGAESILAKASATLEEDANALPDDDAENSAGDSADHSRGDGTTDDTVPAADADTN